jgi:hypothetical protein
MGVSWSDDEALDEEESFDSVKDEEDKDDDDIERPAGRGKDPVSHNISPPMSQKLIRLKSKKKHEAKRKHGERCIPDENTNRDNAIVGRYDPSKLVIEFQTERPDWTNPGHFIPSGPARFEYPNAVNWDDKTSISKLNNWRLQVFKRTIGQKRDSRPPWTINEQNKLLELLHSHLKGTETGGHYSLINWKEIELDFNSFFAEKTHKKGELTAETSYNVRGKDMLAKSRKLVQDRPHTPRSAGAIENQ